MSGLDTGLFRTGAYQSVTNVVRLNCYTGTTCVAETMHSHTAAQSVFYLKVSGRTDGIQISSGAASPWYGLAERKIRTGMKYFFCLSPTGEKNRAIPLVFNKAVSHNFFLFQTASLTQTCLFDDTINCGDFLLNYSRGKKISLLHVDSFRSKRR